MEWPLIFFTTLSQMAAGAFLALAFLHWRKPNLVDNDRFFLSTAILVLTGISMMAATAHLGKPFFAYRAIYHFETSWLSREIIIFSAFMGINFLYSATLYKKLHALAQKLLWLGAIVAFCAVIVTSMIYVLPSHPAWNNFSTPLFFTCTELILGPLFLAVLLKVRKNTIPLELFHFVFVIISLDFIAFFVYLTILAGGSPTMLDCYAKTAHDPLFYVRLLCEAVLPLAYWLFCFLRRKPLSPQFVYLLFCLIFCGEFCGRIIFYSTSVPILLFGI